MNISDHFAYIASSMQGRTIRIRMQQKLSVSTPANENPITLNTFNVMKNTAELWGVGWGGGGGVFSTTARHACKSLWADGDVGKGHHEHSRQGNATRDSTFWNSIQGCLLCLLAIGWGRGSRTEHTYYTGCYSCFFIFSKRYCFI